MPALPLDIQQRIHTRIAQGHTVGFSSGAVKAVFFDMDSTLIQEESIVTIAQLAEEASVLEKIARITESAMAGELDFTQAFYARLALLRGIEKEKIDALVGQLTLNTGIQFTLSQLRQQGIKLFLVSGGFTIFANSLVKKLQMDQAFAHELDFSGGTLNGSIVGNQVVDGAAKKRWVQSKAQELGISSEEICCVGDGANDIAMLDWCGTGVGYQPKTVVKQHIQALNARGDHRFLLPLLLGKNVIKS